jgi:uncharacterized protein (TIGR02266 family)
MGIVIRIPARSATSLPERRDNDRRAVHARVSLGSTSNFYVGVTENVSHGGLFVAVDELPPTGTLLDLKVDLEDGQPPLLLTGEVRWHRESPSAEGARGCGVRFVALSDNHERRIADFLRQRAPLVHPEG